MHCESRAEFGLTHSIESILRDIGCLVSTLPSVPAGPGGRMGKRRERGFTLIELLIVVAIIGILAAIAIPNLMTAVQRAKQKRTMVNIRNIATAWEACAGDLSKYNSAGVGGASVPIAIRVVF